MTSIEEWTFGDCSGLTSLTIPDGVTSIGKGAFKGCEGFTSVTIPDSVTGLEEWAFEDCSGLAKVSLPGHLKGKVPRNVFVGCAPGRRIVYRGGTTTTKTTDENQATHTAVLEVYTFAYSIVFKKIDSFDELDGMDYEDFRDAMGCTDWFGCDVGDIESAKLCVDGEEKTINLFSTQKIEEGKQNSWDTFRGERGIYFNDVDKRGITATCSFTGDFDPSKLRFGYQTVVWGAENLKLLSDVTYAGMPMELDVDDDADGKGCYFLLVDGDRYAEYYFGRDVSALKWQPIPSEENQAKAGEGNEKPAAGTLAGVCCVLTGKLSRSREEYAELIRKVGGVVQSAVTVKTKYLVAGEKTGATKTKKARELGTEVIDEARLIKLLGL